jgi:transcriptional regulator with XRE-family HTH domain
MAIAARLRLALEARGISGNELGRRLEVRGVSPHTSATVNRYIAGGTTPSADWLLEAAHELDVSPRWLIEGSGVLRRADESTSDPIDQALEAAGLVGVDPAVRDLFRHVVSAACDARPGAKPENVAADLAELLADAPGHVALGNPAPASPAFTRYAIATLLAYLELIGG